VNLYIQKNFLGVTILLTGVITLALTWGVLWVSRPGAPTPPPAVVAPPKTIGGECPEGTRQILSGKETYKVDTEKYLDPKIMEISFDPLDVKRGETQIVTVKVHNPDTDTVTNNHTASVSYLMDSGQSKTFPLSMILANGKNEVQAAINDIVTTWQGSIPNPDTHCVHYMATVIAANDNGEHKVEISVR